MEGFSFPIPLLVFGSHHSIYLLSQLANNSIWREWYGFVHLIHSKGGNKNMFHNVTLLIEIHAEIPAHVGAHTVFVYSGC